MTFLCKVFRPCQHFPKVSQKVDGSNQDKKFTAKMLIIFIFLSKSSSFLNIFKKYHKQLKYFSVFFLFSHIFVKFRPFWFFQKLPQKGVCAMVKKCDNVSNYFKNSSEHFSKFITKRLKYSKLKFKKKTQTFKKYSPLLWDTVGPWPLHNHSCRPCHQS